MVRLLLLATLALTSVPDRHVDRIGDLLRREAVQDVERIPPPQKEIEGEFTIDDKTVIVLDGKPIAFENIPKDGSIEVVELLVDTEKKRVVKMTLRTVKAANP